MTVQGGTPWRVQGRALALLLLAFLTLSSCSARLDGGAALPAPDLVLVMRDGARLPAREWVPGAGVARRGVILALHGFDDSRDAWELPAPIFAAAGYVVVAPDQRGFGGTADRGHWAGGARMVEDAAELSRQMRARFAGLPLTVMGESMGGAVALCLAARSDAPDARYVLLAPAVLDRATLGPVVSATLFLARHLAPGWRLTGREVPLGIAASDNRDALIRLGRDPLTLKSADVRTLVGITDLMDAAQGCVPHLHGSVLILDGRLDQVIPPAATAAAWAKLPAGVRRGFYPNGFHLLLRDRDRALVDADILSWLEDPAAPLPSGGDVAAAAWGADQAWRGQPAGGLPAALLDGAGRAPVWPF